MERDGAHLSNTILFVARVLRSCFSTYGTSHLSQMVVFVALDTVVVELLPHHWHVASDQHGRSRCSGQSRGGPAAARTARALENTASSVTLDTVVGEPLRHEHGLDSPLLVRDLRCTIVLVALDKIVVELLQHPSHLR